MTIEQTRRAGILVPLFSIPSARSWGIGEIGDLVPLCEWLKLAGYGIVQILPITEMPPGETSPYSALSAMAIDPQFIGLSDLEDFAALGGEAALDADMRGRLQASRAAARVDYATVRPLKLDVLRRCFARFTDQEWRPGTARAASLRAYIEAQAWWLEDYALYRAIHADLAETAWQDWPVPLRTREAAALAEARTRLADAILFRQYLQWIADSQWKAAREAVSPIALFGDLPFMVGGDSADVWARQDEFRLDASVGVPPDAFSDTGQDWGLPPYRWDVMASSGFEWLRQRARRTADLYNGYRVDHLVGFYRTYVRPHDGGPPAFTPAGEADQLALGERVLTLFRDAGADLVAEDLGTVPAFVRESLLRLDIPGYKVMRWEREWETPGQPFTSPLTYPPASLATTGTHDTEAIADWWEEADRAERLAVLALPLVRVRLTAADVAAAANNRSPSAALHDALLAALHASRSRLLILPLQDVFRWRDRINQPATVGDWNWTWRMRWPVDRLTQEPVALERARQLRTWCEEFDRTGVH